MSKKQSHQSVSRPEDLTLPELEQSKISVLSTLASAHSRRSYQYAIDKFIGWYCSQPRLGFNRSVVVRYRSSLECLSLSAATINLHLSAVRRLADESAESGWLSQELVSGIRRVKGVKRLGRRIGNWLTADQAQELLNAVPLRDALLSMSRFCLPDRHYSCWDEMVRGCVSLLSGRNVLCGSERGANRTTSTMAGVDTNTYHRQGGGLHHDADRILCGQW